MCRFASASILHGDLIKYLFRKLLLKIAGTPDPSSAGRLASAPLRWQDLFLYTKLPRYQDENSTASKVICSRLFRPVSLRCASPCARGNIRRHITTPLTLTLFLLYLGNHPFPCALACEMRQLASDAGRPVQLVYWLDAPTTRAERSLPQATLGRMVIIVHDYCHEPPTDRLARTVGSSKQEPHPVCPLHTTVHAIHVSRKRLANEPQGAAESLGPFVHVDAHDHFSRDLNSTGRGAFAALPSPLCLSTWRSCHAGLARRLSHFSSVRACFQGSHAHNPIRLEESNLKREGDVKLSRNLRLFGNF